MPPSDGAERPCVVAVLRSLAPRHVAQIEAVDPRVRVVPVTDRATWLEEAPDAEVIMGFRPLREGALRARRLRWVHQSGAGVENLTDDVAGTGIVVTNSHVHAESISEHIFALVLAHTRRLREIFTHQERREWMARGLFYGQLVAGRTMGVLGLGAVGRAVAARAEAFGMRVWGVKRTPGPVPGVERVVPPSDLDQVLRVADVLVVTLPLTRATRGLLGARELALLPAGAFVVNTGRGALIDEAALVEALREGRLGGAGLDVFVDEPLPPTSPLWTAPNVIVSPHRSGSFPEYMDRVIVIFCDNLARYLTAQPLQSVVDIALGY